MRFKPEAEYYLKDLIYQEIKHKEHLMREKELDFQERQLKIQEEQDMIQKEQLKIQKIQTNIQKSQSRATWWQVITASILIIITIILGYTNYKLLKQDVAITSKTAIPNYAELKITPFDNHFVNRTLLFQGNHYLVLTVENKGRINSGRVFLSLNTDLNFNEYPYIIEDISEKNKSRLKIGLVPSCIGETICSEKLIPLGVTKLTVFLSCESCEPHESTQTINICIFGDVYSYNDCQRNYPK